MRNLALCLIGWVFFLPCMGQARQDAREIFEDGLFFFNRGDYKEAAYNFRRLAEQFPDQSNYQYKLGECYMNMPGSECLAVPCFETAVKHTVPKQKYDRKAFEETDAPLHAWFYLGNVYRVCNRLSDALHAYTTFVNSPYYEGNYNLAIVENEIKSCERAKIIEDNPIAMTEQLLDTMVNTQAAELHPVFSADGNTLIFIRRLKFYDAILQSERINGTWSAPVNLNPQVGSDGEYYPACISPDGNDLYLIKTGVNSDIWVSHRNGGAWSRAEKLNDRINSAFNETSAWISGSGVLYFASTRKGGAGGSDLWYSRVGSNGDWGKPKNMGKTINTPFDEDSPCLIPGDSVLFFSSKGHFSMGGYDIFTARRTEKAWRDPANVGFPINNTSDNNGYVALNGGFSGYYSRINAGDPSREEDIFEALLTVKP